MKKILNYILLYGTIVYSVLFLMCAESLIENLPALACIMILIQATLIFLCIGIFGDGKWKEYIPKWLSRIDKDLTILAIFLTVSISSFSNNTISKDTVLLETTYKIVKIEKTNSLGEIHNSYYVILPEYKNRKIRTDKSSYELYLINKDLPLFVIYSNKKDNSKIIIKAYVSSNKRKEKD